MTFLRCNDFPSQFMNVFFPTQIGKLKLLGKSPDVFNSHESLLLRKKYHGFYKQAIGTFGVTVYIGSSLLFSSVTNNKVKIEEVWTWEVNIEETFSVEEFKFFTGTTRKNKNKKTTTTTTTIEIEIKKNVCKWNKRHGRTGRNSPRYETKVPVFSVV